MPETQSPLQSRSALTAGPANGPPRSRTQLLAVERALANPTPMLSLGELVAQARQAEGKNPDEDWTGTHPETSTPAKPDSPRPLNEHGTTPEQLAAAEIADVPPQLAITSGTTTVVPRVDEHSTPEQIATVKIADVLTQPVITLGTIPVAQPVAENGLTPEQLAAVETADVLPVVPRGVQLPDDPADVRRADGTTDLQATGQDLVQVLLPAIATLIGAGRDHAEVLQELQGMPAAGVYATLQQHAVDSFRAYAEHGGEAPDLATVETALMRLRNAQLAAAPEEPALSSSQAEPSAFLAGLTERTTAGLDKDELPNHFNRGNARGTGNVCVFDTLYQLANTNGRGDQLLPFTGGAVGEAGRTAFAARMQQLLEPTGLLSSRPEGGYDQLELQGGSFAANLLADVTGLRLTVMSHSGGTVQQSATSGNAGPEAFMLRTGGTDGHVEPLWPQGLKPAPINAEGIPKKTSTNKWKPSLPTLAENQPLADDARAPRRANAKLPKPPRPEPEPQLDAVQHKLHRTTFERVTGKPVSVYGARPSNWSTMVGGKAIDAPTGTAGKPVLAKPDDTNALGRVDDILKGTEEILASLDAAPTEPAPMGRPPKPGVGARLKSAVFGAKSQHDLAARLHSGVSSKTSDVLSKVVGQTTEQLRNEVTKLATDVTTAMAARDQAIEAQRHCAYADRATHKAAEKRATKDLKQAIEVHDAVVNLLTSGDIRERLAQGKATLQKIAYSEGELTRFQSELAKLAVPGELPGPAARWAGRLMTLSDPVTKLLDKIGGEGDDGAVTDANTKALAGVLSKAGKAADGFDDLGKALLGARTEGEARESVLRTAEEVVSKTEAVYLELSNAVKRETRALRIADAHADRLLELMNDPAVEDFEAVSAAFDTAQRLSVQAAATVDLLREARTALKQDIVEIRETYHAIALEVTQEAALEADGAALPTGAKKAADSVAGALTAQDARFTEAKETLSTRKKDKVKAETERVTATVDKLIGFTAAPGASAAGMEALRAQVRTAANGLNPKRQGTELSASAVLRSVNNALSQVTGGDPERAAQVLQAVTHHSMLHWLGDEPTDDPTVKDVRALHRLMSTMPGGMQALGRLSMEAVDLGKDKNAAADRNTVSALRVHWLADDALHKLDARALQTPVAGEAPAVSFGPMTEIDHADRKWLGAAKSKASSDLRKALTPASADVAIVPFEPMTAAKRAEAEATERKELAAFNGVRNGYLSIAPGSPYQRGNKMLDKLMTKWTVAPDMHRVPLDENLSSNQIRAAADKLADFVDRLPGEQSKPADALVRAFAEFGRNHPELHANSKLSDAHTQELIKLALPQPPEREEGSEALETAMVVMGPSLDQLPEDAFLAGMTFAEALANTARLAKQNRQTPEAKKELLAAMEEFKPGTGLRQTGLLAKVGDTVGMVASSVVKMNPNPLNRLALSELNKMSSGLGMNTRAKMSEDEMKSAFFALETAAGAAGKPELAMICDALRRASSAGPADRELSRDFAKALQTKLDTELPGHGQTVRTDLTLHAYATTLLSSLRTAEANAMTPEQAGDIEATLDKAFSLTLHPELPTVKTLDDVAEVVTQFVSEDELRDKRKILNGTEFGVTVPLMPWGVPHVPFGANVKYSRKSEEMFEVGMYINLAEITTHKFEAGASAGYGRDGGKHDGPEQFTLNLATAALNVGYERQTATTLSMRLPRQRGTEAKLREQVPQMVKDLALHAAQVADADALQEYPDAMSTLLAQHQDLAIVVTDDQGASTVSAEARLNLLSFGQKPKLLPPAKPKPGEPEPKPEREPHDAGIGGTALGISGSLEYASEWKKESIGGFTTNDQTSSVKAGLSLDSGFRMPIKIDNHTEDLRLGKLSTPGIGTGVAGISRNFFQRLDKKQISEASSEGATIDADLDEFSYSPNDILEDLQSNRAAWLERGLNVLMKRKQEDGSPEVEPHQRETVGRRIAEAELVQFEAAIKEMGKNDKFTQFNINYSLNDDAKGLLGDLRLDEELARSAGDTAEADKLAKQHLELLQNPASWEPNKVMARVKAKVATNVGADLFFKAKATFQVEGQRVPWQFPA